MFAFDWAEAARVFFQLAPPKLLHFLARSQILIMFFKSIQIFRKYAYYRQSGTFPVPSLATIFFSSLPFFFFFCKILQNRLLTI